MVATGLKRLIVNSLHRVGYDLVRYPNPVSIGEKLKHILSGGSITCVVDVGANVGQFAAGLRRSGYAGPIVSFEPVQAHFDSLSKACSDDPLWTCHRLALGSCSNELTLNVMSDGVFSSFLDPSRDGKEQFPANVIDHKEMTQVQRLDAIFGTLMDGDSGRRVFLKIDTQGYDLEVFRGSAGCLDSIALLQMELSVRPIYENAPRWLDVVREVSGHGFSLAGLDVVNQDSRLAVIEYDGLFVR